MDATQLLPPDPARSRLADWLRQESAADPGFGLAIAVACGACVYAVGSEDRALYLVERGQVAVVLHDLAAGRCVTGRIQPGGVFGESAFSGRPRPEEALALADAVVMRIPLDLLLARARQAEVLDLLLEHLGACLSRSQAIASCLLAMPQAPPATPSGLPGDRG